MVQVLLHSHSTRPPPPVTMSSPNPILLRRRPQTTRSTLFVSPPPPAIHDTTLSTAFPSTTHHLHLLTVIFLKKLTPLRRVSPAKSFLSAQQIHDLGTTHISSSLLHHLIDFIFRSALPPTPNRHLGSASTYAPRTCNLFYKSILLTSSVLQDIAHLNRQSSSLPMAVNKIRFIDDHREMVTGKLTMNPPNPPEPPDPPDSCKLLDSFQMAFGSDLSLSPSSSTSNHHASTLMNPPDLVLKCPKSCIALSEFSIYVSISIILFGNNSKQHYYSTPPASLTRDGNLRVYTFPAVDATPAVDSTPVVDFTPAYSPIFSLKEKSVFKSSIFRAQFVHLSPMTIEPAHDLVNLLIVLLVIICDVTTLSSIYVSALLIFVTSMNFVAKSSRLVSSVMFFF